MENTKTHCYEVEVSWTGNLGSGTAGYREYSRNHEITVPGKPVLQGSSDPHFRGDPTRYNPEELLVGSLAACQMLWYLHLCADAGIVVTDYQDRATGTMIESEDGGGRFQEVVLAPRVKVREGADLKVAAALHEEAHQKCFIASSVNFEVRCEPTIETSPNIQQQIAAI